MTVIQESCGLPEIHDWQLWLRFVRQLRLRTSIRVAIKYLRRCLTSAQVRNRGVVLMTMGKVEVVGGLLYVIDRTLVSLVPINTTN